jgi:predicted Zn-dependent protease
MKLTALFVLTAFISFGQTLKDAIRKTDNERYSDALNDFNSLIAKEPNIGDNYFYFGQYYMIKGEIDSAKMIWAKGFQMDNLSPLSLVGNGSVIYLNGNSEGAKLEFEKALTATKGKKDNIKNAEVRRGIATIYIKSEKKNLDEAIKTIEEAILKDPNNEENYLLQGDALYEKTPNNASAAIKSYNKVLEINPKSPRGIVRVAIIYQRAQSPDEAQKKYNDAKQVDSTYAPAYRENAELNMRFNQPKKAIENWKKYLRLNNTIEARYRYATAMFLGKQYCEVIEEINSLYANGFTNFYTDRMLGYSYVECTTDPEGYKKGLSALDRFFASAPADKIQWLDIKNKGIMPLVDAARLFILSMQIKGVNNTYLRFKQLSITDPKYSEIYLSCAEAFLVLSKIRTLEGLKNDSTGQFISIEELSKSDKEKLKNALAPIRDLEELIKDRFQLTQFS